MKKRFLAILLTLTMIFTVLPQMAFQVRAADDFVIENNEFYDTYLFRASGSAKKYLRVAAQNYKSGGDRLAPVYAVLDNVFTSGKGIFNNTLKNGSLKWLNSLYNILNDIEEEDPDEPEDPEEEEEEEEVEGEAGETRYGFVDDESMIVSGSYSYNDKFDLDDENRYGQPYGVPYTVNQKMRCTVVRGRVVSYTVEGKQVYSYGGYNYEEFFSIDHVYSEVTSADLVIPNKANYTEVFDLFDLY